MTASGTHTLDSTRHLLRFVAVVWIWTFINHLVTPERGTGSHKNVAARKTGKRAAQQSQPDAKEDVLKETVSIQKEDSLVLKNTEVAAASAAGGADVIPVSASRSSAGVVGRATRDTTRD